MEYSLRTFGLLRGFVSIAAIICSLLNGSAQVPFICDGTKYVNNLDNGFYSIDFDIDSDTIVLTELFKVTGYNIQAIGYNSKDNLIYGSALHDGKYYLCRIDQTGTMEILYLLPFEPQNNYEGLWSADITPDGSKIILMAIQNNKNLLYIVNLDSGNYEVEQKELETLEGAPLILVDDIVFSPIDEKLYAYDDQDVWLNQPNPYGGKLVVIDYLLGTIDNVQYSQTPVRPPLLLALMSDPFGEIYGINGIFSIYPWWIQIGTQTGQLDYINLTSYNEPWSPLTANFFDGCSCPYTIVVQHEIQPEQAFACTELEFKFRITNQTKEDLSPISFIDTLPSGFIFQEIIQNPYGGNVQGLGTGIVTITDLDLPQGTDSLIFLAYVEEGTAGKFFNQAFLSNLDLGGAHLGTNIIKSDFPSTIARFDATPIEISPLKLDLLNDEFELCLDSSVILPTISTQMGISFLWSTGSMENEITVLESGIYTVTIVGGCEADTASFYVFDSPLLVDLGPDTIGQFGDLIQMKPQYEFLTPISYYNWLINEPNVLECNNCDENSFTLAKDALVKLIVKSEAGCRSESSVRITATKEVFASNAFSPNGDGINDVFYLQTKYDLPVQQLKVFARWGEMVYEGVNGTSNDIFFGWDGNVNGKPSQTGVYGWMAVLEYPDRERTVFSGDILLVR